MTSKKVMIAMASRISTANSSSIRSTKDMTFNRYMLERSLSCLSAISAAQNLPDIGKFLVKREQLIRTQDAVGCSLETRLSRGNLGGPVAVFLLFTFEATCRSDIPSNSMHCFI